MMDDNEVKSTTRQAVGLTDYTTVTTPDIHANEDIDTNDKTKFHVIDIDIPITLYYSIDESLANGIKQEDISRKLQRIRNRNGVLTCDSITTPFRFVEEFFFNDEKRHDFCEAIKNYKTVLPLFRYTNIKVNIYNSENYTGTFDEEEFDKSFLKSLSDDKIFEEILGDTIRVCYFKVEKVKTDSPNYLYKAQYYVYVALLEYYENLLKENRPYSRLSIDEIMNKETNILGYKEKLLREGYTLNYSRWCGASTFWTACPSHEFLEFISVYDRHKDEMEIIASRDKKIFRLVKFDRESALDRAINETISGIKYCGDFVKKFNDTFAIDKYLQFKMENSYSKKEPESILGMFSKDNDLCLRLHGDFKGTDSLIRDLTDIKDKAKDLFDFLRVFLMALNTYKEKNLNIMNALNASIRREILTDPNRFINSHNISNDLRQCAKLVLIEPEAYEAETNIMNDENKINDEISYLIETERIISKKSKAKPKLSKHIKALMFKLLSEDSEEVGYKVLSEESEEVEAEDNEETT